MKWHDVKEKQPEHNEIVLVKLKSGFAVAEYDNCFGFNADDSALDIYAHHEDDSGMEVNLDGEVLEWCRIERQGE